MFGDPAETGPVGARAHRIGPGAVRLAVHRAAQAAERIRTTVSNLAIPHDKNAAPQRGFDHLGATLISATDMDLTDEPWLDRAGQALYRAKAAGRNRVAGAPSDPVDSAATTSAA